MVRNTATLALVLVGLMAVSGHHQSDDYWKNYAARSSVAQSINNFSYDYLLKFDQYEHENKVFSAFNEYVIFKELIQGAYGHTKEQLYKKLYYNGTEFEKSGFASLFQYFYSFSEFEFYAKNKIFYPSSVTIKQSFFEALKEFYKAEPYGVDFVKHEEAYKAINEWAKKASNSHIGNFISESNSNKFDEKTSLFLASALYFKPKFLFPINASLTAPKPFYYPDGTSENFPSMSFKGVFNAGYFFSDFSVKFIQIPFAFKEYSHVAYLNIMIPADNHDLKYVEDKFKEAGFVAPVSQEYRKFEVSLPKFKAESSGDLKKYFTDLDVFADNADFSGASESPLKISQIYQKIVFEIDDTSNEKYPYNHGKFAEENDDNSNHEIKFDINKPFLYSVHSNNVELFFGRVVKPYYKN